MNVVTVAAIKTISVQPIQSWCPPGLDRSFTLPIVGLTFIAMLGGCAGVRVTPLNPDGTPTAGAKEGMRYYMPAPYLLVARMPPIPSSEPAGPKKDPNPSDKEKKDSEVSSTAPAGGAPSSNTSFLASTPQYMLKLVYLPDKTKPMAMSVRTGLFGAASMKPALQDGWMLTSLDASADSKTAETLTAIASLMSSAATGGAGAAAKGGKPALTGQNLAETVKDFSDKILKPGLYKFVYDDASGQLIGLHAVTYFTDNGVVPEAYVHRTSGK